GLAAKGTSEGWESDGNSGQPIYQAKQSPI
ncbi:hypothetical protein LCGC14_2852700, partial [marine sediment metagenome]